MTHDKPACKVCIKALTDSWCAGKQVIVSKMWWRKDSAEMAKQVFREQEVERIQREHRESLCVSAPVREQANWPKAQVPGISYLPAALWGLLSGG